MPATAPASDRISPNGHADDSQDRGIIRPSAAGTIGAFAEQQRVTAEIQSRLMAAKSCPRDEVDAVERIKIACQRVGLAEKAEYVYPRGGQEVRGPSIDLLQVIATCWGNIDFGFRELSQGNGESTIECYAWDLETNTKEVRVVTIPHKRFADGRLKPLIDPRDVYENNANNAQRRVRACLECIIPPDVVEDAVSECHTTLKTKVTVDENSIAKLVDAFEKFNVTKDQLALRLGRRLESMQPAQLVRLRAIWKSLSDGMSEPSDWFKTPEDASATESPKTATESAKAALKAQKAAPPAEAAPIPNDPFPSSPAPAETAEKPEEKKTTTKPRATAPTVEKQAANGGAQRETAAAPAKPFNPDRYRGYASMTYESDLGDFDLDKIIAECGGHADPKALIDSIFKRKHPDFESYLTEKLRPKPTEKASKNDPENDSQELETLTTEDSQDAPDFVREPLPRPKKLCLMATDYEKTIIGKRSFEQIRQYLETEIKANPHLEQHEEAYLLDLGKRRAYQIEHSITPTDKLPK